MGRLYVYFVIVKQKENKNEYCCRIAPSLGGGFSGTPKSVWKTKDYVFKEDKYKATCFFGMYDLRDYVALWRHRGRAWILWAGGDLRNLDKGFVLNDGKLSWLSRFPLFRPGLIRLIKTAENWVENEWESRILSKYGIPHRVCPSFLGNVKDYKVSYKSTKNPSYYLSANPGREKEYGWDIVEEMAERYPDVSFHLYGSNKWKTKQKNVIIHGRVPIKQMDKETCKMTGALRLNNEDGFSEILAKSILWGQYPVSSINYPYIASINAFAYGKNPNIEGRNYYLRYLNNYPWNSLKSPKTKKSRSNRVKKA